MRLDQTLILAACAWLAACTPMQWVKPGADAQHVDADTAQCRQQARSESWLHSWTFRPMAPVVGLDAQGRRFVYWQHDTFSDPFGDRFMEEVRLTDYCLRAKGYALVPVPKEK